MASRPSPLPACRPDVLRYDDFRRFLRDAFAFEKRRNPGFSYAVFARRADLASRSHLKNVLDYGQDLTAESLAKYAKGFRLSGDRADYFSLLVRANQAKDPKAREAAQGALNRWRWEREYAGGRAPGGQGLRRKELSHLVLAASRLYGFRPDPGWVSRRFGGRLSPSEAGEILAFLRKEGLLRVRGGRLVRTEARPFKAQDDAHVARFSRWAFREAASADAKEEGDSVVASAILTPEQAKALYGKLHVWLGENIPFTQGRRLKGEIYLLAGSIFPVTRR